MVNNLNFFEKKMGNEPEFPQSTLNRKIDHHINFAHAVGNKFTVQIFRISDFKCGPLSGTFNSNTHIFFFQLGLSYTCVRRPAYSPPIKVRHVKYANGL